MIYYALVSPQGHTELNALVCVGQAALDMEHGKFYTNEQLHELSGRPDGAWFLDHSSQAIEKNIKKWRFEKQEL